MEAALAESTGGAEEPDKARKYLCFWLVTLYSLDRYNSIAN